MKKPAFWNLYNCKDVLKVLSNLREEDDRNEVDKNLEQLKHKKGKGVIPFSLSIIDGLAEFKVWKQLF